MQFDLAAACTPDVPSDRPALVESTARPAGGSSDVLWSQLWQRLRGLAQGIVRNWHDAEDIAAEVMRRVFDRFPRWCSLTDVWPFAVCVARNLARNMLRYNQLRCIGGASMPRPRTYRSLACSPPCVPDWHRANSICSISGSPAATRRPSAPRCWG